MFFWVIKNNYHAFLYTYRDVQTKNKVSDSHFKRTETEMFSIHNLSFYTYLLISQAALTCIY